MQDGLSVAPPPGVEPGPSAFRADAQTSYARVGWAGEAPIMERTAGVEPAIPEWRSGVSPPTLRPQGAPGGTRGCYHRRMDLPIHDAILWKACLVAKERLGPDAIGDPRHFFPLLVRGSWVNDTNQVTVFTDRI